MDKRHGASPTIATAAVVTNKPLVFSKMESLVREMQDPESGIPIRSQKIFLTSIPSAFMGYDLVEWLMDRLEIEDSAEAIHLANLLCQYGYFFPVGETRSLIVKDDSSLYRFQTPYYWPSQNHSADTTDYAIYLTKRQSRNKQKHGLEDYEVESFNKLRKGLQHKWDFILMQAEEQVRLAKDRKKGDKIVTDSQERAYWRVYRPPPGFTNCLESAPVPDRNNMANRVKKKTVESSKLEIELLRKQIERTRIKVSIAGEALLTHAETYFEFDCFLVPPLPTNPWVTDDTTFWVLNESLVDVPTEKRVRRWGVSCSELVNDLTGLNEFTNYLRKEYSHENIRFWQAVLDLRYGPAGEVSKKVNNIYEEFLKAGAPCEINIDGKTMEQTQQSMKTPSRYTYDLAAEHVYDLLLKKDCYPRFLRSEHYKNLLANAIQPLQKKRFFSFGGPGKKKASAISSSNSVSLQAQTPQPLKRHGSDEQTATTQSGANTLGDNISLTPVTVLQPRVDCEPPYSCPSDRPGGDSDVCPWESSAEPDNVCPWEATSTPAQRTVSTPTQPHRLQQSLHHSLQPRAQLSKTRPDRSKSMEVHSPGPQRPTTSVPFAPTPVPIRGPAPGEGAPVVSRGEKAQSVDVCPWKSHPPAKKTPSTGLALPRDPSSTSGPPVMTVPSPISERRASEGVLKMALGVTTLDEVLQRTRKKEAQVRISIEEDRSGATVPSPLDLSVRSGHLRGLLGLQSDPTSPPRSALELSIATSMAALTCPASGRDSLPLKETSKEDPRGALLPQMQYPTSPSFDTESQVTPVNPLVLVHVKEGDSEGSPRKSPKSESTWENPQPQKAADVCPWEDDSLTPTWL